MLRMEPLRAAEHLMGSPSDGWIDVTDNGENNAEIRYEDVDAEEKGEQVS